MTTSACVCSGRVSCEPGCLSLDAVVGHAGLCSGDLRALPPALDLVTAAKALGIGRTTAYSLARRDEFPCRLIKVGSQYKVPTAELLRLLGLAPEASAGAEAGAGGCERNDCP